MESFRKRTTALLLALLMLATITPLRFQANAASLVTGDVNLDGKVGSDDARLALRASVKLELLHDDAMRCADADHDNKITSADARLILRASVGLETLAPMPDTSTQTVVYQTRQDIPPQKLTFPGGKAETLGSRKDTNVTLTVQPGSLTAGTEVSVTRMTKEEVQRVFAAGKWERMLFPMNVTCTGYDGVWFDDGVTLTIPLMEEHPGADVDYSRFVFCYYDETAKQVHYLWPDEIDAKNGTMSLSLPHFSFWWGVKLTDAELIELFLDRYCMQQAIGEGKRKQAATQIEPYLTQKAEAIGLTVTATKNLVESAITYLGGNFVFEDDDDVGFLSGTFSNGVTFTTKTIRAHYENKPEDAKNALSGAANSAVALAWKELKFSERAAEVFKKEYVKDFLPGSVNTLIANFGDVGTLLGCITEGDTEGVMQTLGSIMENIHPAAGLVTKACAFIGTSLHTGFTFWKSNQIEELYQVYKNGGTFLFCNEVFPRDRNSFLTFLNTSSGFTLAKGVKRFFNLDKIEEICRKYGWSFKSYSELPQRYRDIFEKRAENGLMEYFEMRAAQEDRAEQLKAEERENINTMLNETFGALRREYHSKFFHETDGYNVTDRLERLVRVKSFIDMYIYNTKLKFDPAYNWGDMLNMWVNYAESNSKEDAIELFTDELKRIGLLSPAMDVKAIDEAMRAKIQPFVGTWVCYEDSTVLNAYNEPIDVTDQITIEVFYNLKGRLAIQQTRQRVKYDGAPTTGDPHVGGVSVKEGEFTVANSTLTVPSDSAASGYSFKLKVSGNTMTSYTVHPWDGYETSITLTKKK
ncbi:MAG: dockerin type I repeat-containing protein [Clostridia bacterium]|nr:dockerin type I repeat-containing protein [Clostridia bacterium]